MQLQPTTCMSVHTSAGRNSMVCFCANIIIALQVEFGYLVLSTPIVHCTKFTATCTVGCPITVHVNW